MKKNIRIFFAVSAILLILAAAVACKPEGTPPTDSSAEAVTTAEPIAFLTPNEITQYKFVRPDTVDRDEIDFYLGYFRAMQSKFPSAELTIGNDFLMKEQQAPEYEILVGPTARAETAEALEGLGDFDYVVAVVGKKLVIAGKTLEATKLALDYFMENMLTEDSLTLAADFRYQCLSGPVVISASPVDSTFIEGVYSPEITILYSCEPEIDLSKTVCTVDGADMTSKISVADGSLTLSGQAFTDGYHEMKLTLADTRGGFLYYTYTFGCGKITDEMKLYTGEVHAHTSLSDGKLLPADAYEYVIANKRADFFAVTDHSNSMDASEFASKLIPVTKEFLDEGNFIPLFGFEHTYNISTGYYGHLNLINSTTHTTRNSHNLTEFYRLLGTLSGTGAIAQFNHPNYAWGNFEDFRYDAEADKTLNLFELKGSGYDIQYALCLTKGWHVSPMHNEDNHSANWTTVNDATSVVCAPSLTYASIIDAMEKKRTYTTTDSSLEIYYTINGEWLGSTLYNPSELNISVKLKTEKSSGLGTVYIMTEDNIIAASKSFGKTREATWELTLSPDYDYYYVKVSTSEIFSVTAPVWVDGNNAVSITDLDEATLIDDNVGMNYAVTATVKNNTTDTLTDVTVSFYVSGENGLALTAKPVATVNVGSIAAGREIKASANLTATLTNRRFTAVVTAKHNGKSCADTRYMQNANLIVTEILPTSGSYNFIELYNTTEAPIDLSGYTFKYFTAAGASESKGNLVSWKLSGTIAPKSTMTVWIKLASNTLTVADFNAHFGTSLVEGENIIIVNSTTALPSTAGKSIQIQLLSGSATVGFSWYNWGDNTKELSSGKSVTYRYNDYCTQVYQKISAKSIPSPGTVTAEQIPTLMTVSQWTADGSLKP